jgi:Immunoglobulin domain/CARDB
VGAADRKRPTMHATAFRLPLAILAFVGVALFFPNTAQAAAQTATAGQAVTFSVSADGTSPFSYQWYKNSVAISGATSSSYTLSACAACDTGTYYVVVSNLAGSTTSDNAVLTVNTAPAITTQPTNQAATVGASVTFTAAASGTPAPTYQWQKNGVNISGATNASYTIASVAATDDATYTVVATNSAGSAISSSATLTVLSSLPNAVAYRTTTFPDTVTSGAAVSFSYNVTNIGTKTWGGNHYLWLRDANGTTLEVVPLSGVAPGGSRTVILSFTAPVASGIYVYYVQAFEAGVELFSTQVALALAVVPSLPNAITCNTTTFPDTVTPGAAIDFSYDVTNTGTKTWGGNHYLWLRDANGTTLDIVPLSGVAPGESRTVNLSFTAPMTPGTYTYYVQALEAGVELFSTQTTLILAVVPSLPNALTFNTTTFPDTVTPGVMVPFSYNVTNTGTKTWGGNHYLWLRDANGTALSIVTLSGVAPGGSRTVNLSFIAPATPGIYTYYVQALEAGVELFSTQETLILAVVPSLPNALTYNTTTFPNTATRGATVRFSYNVTNTGTKTWGGNHYLWLRDANDTTLNVVPISGVAPGGSRTVNLGFTAPMTPGTYTYYVQALEAGVELFSTQATLLLTVQ